MKRATVLAFLPVFLLGACNCPEGKTGDSGSDPDSPGPEQPGQAGPYADLQNSLGTVSSAPLRGRVVEEDGPVDPLQTIPTDVISQDELKNTTVTLSLSTGEDLGSAQTNDEGFLDEVLDLTGLDLAPGEHTLQLRVDGELAGVTTLTLLADDHADPVIRSDVDLTYLDTDFQTKAAMVLLLAQTASERSALPGMPEVYQALAKPTIFLSGSPKFFERILDGKMQLDGVQDTGLVLKPYKGLIALDIARGDFSEIIPNLEEQVGYKLEALMRLRLEIPSGVPEILMGDDSEADYIVYNLYHRFTAGELDTDALLAECDTLGVAAVWRGQIETLAPQILSHLEGHSAPVLAIYINDTDVESHADPIENWIIDGMTVHHAGAVPLVEDLAANGWVDASAVDVVTAAVE